MTMINPLLQRYLDKLNAVKCAIISKLTKVLFLSILPLSSLILWNCQRGISEDAGLNVKQLIEKYGYPFENHTVVTEDGYILELHRIPHGKNSSHYDNRQAILVVHGLLSTSADWINGAQERSLGFLLADQGYDVWLANCRGSTWSRKHVKWDPDIDRQLFWNFSFEEMGYYDLPAFIDYILSTVNQKSLFYLGHSQGTSVYLILGSQKPEYMEKVKIGAFYGPSGHVKHTTSFYLRIFALTYGMLQIAMNDLHFYEFMPTNAIMGGFGRFFCNDHSPFQGLCACTFYLAAGYSEHFDKSLMPVITSNAPAGSSMKQIMHYTQMSMSGLFCRYDYGQKENIKRYGQETPPRYDLSRVTSPIAIYYGSEDVYASKIDIEVLVSDLPNVVKLEYLQGFSHIDYVWGKDSLVLHKDLLQLLNKYL